MGERTPSSRQEIEDPCEWTWTKIKDLSVLQETYNFQTSCSGSSVSRLNFQYTFLSIWKIIILWQFHTCLYYSSLLWESTLIKRHCRGNWFTWLTVPGVWFIMMSKWCWQKLVGSPSGCNNRQEAKSTESWYSAGFLHFMMSGTQAQGMLLSTFRVSLLSSVS